MYICICRAITDRQITEAVCQGEVKCIRDLNSYVGLPTQCGKCCSSVKQIVNDTLNTINQN